MEPTIGSVRENVSRSIALIKETALDGAKSIVLPELNGRALKNRTEAFALAQPIPERSSTRLAGFTYTPSLAP